MVMVMLVGEEEDVGGEYCYYCWVDCYACWWM